MILESDVDSADATNVAVVVAAAGLNDEDEVVVVEVAYTPSY